MEFDHWGESMINRANASDAFIDSKVSSFCVGVRSLRGYESTEDTRNHRDDVNESRAKGDTLPGGVSTYFASALSTTKHYTYWRFWDLI